MSDDENGSKSGDEKPEIKDNASESEGDVDKEKESDNKTNVAGGLDAPKKEEKTIKKEEKTTKKEEKTTKEENTTKKVEKNQNDDKNVKKDKTTKKEEEEEDDNDEDDDDDEEELPPGLLERPLEVEGKREKKKVERLSATMISSPQEKKKLEIEKGSGKKLGDIPYVEHQLNSTKAIDLKHLHKVLFLRAGTNNEIKKNIKQFSGFTHGKDSKEHEKRLACLNKLVLAELKAICIVLGLERGGTKVNLVDRVMGYLMKPKDKGLNIKTKTKKRSRSSGGKTKSTKGKKSNKTAKKGKADKDSDNSQEDGSDENEDEEEEEQVEEEEEEEEDEQEEESEDEPPKKKKKKVENKKKTQKKSTKENGKKEKPVPKKETKKPAAKKKPASELSDSLSEDSEDEPIANMKKSPPSNDEIKNLVKTILDGADLETVTMKTVVKQVYAKYPSFDLSDRKDFIKDTVREVIS